METFDKIATMFKQRSEINSKDDPEYKKKTMRIQALRSGIGMGVEVSDKEMEENLEYHLQQSGDTDRINTQNMVKQHKADVDSLKNNLRKAEDEISGLKTKMDADEKKNDEERKAAKKKSEEKEKQDQKRFDEMEKKFKEEVAKLEASVRSLTDEKTKLNAENEGLKLKVKEQEDNLEAAIKQAREEFKTQVQTKLNAASAELRECLASKEETVHTLVEIGEELAGDPSRSGFQQEDKVRDVILKIEDYFKVGQKIQEGLKEIEDA